MNCREAANLPEAMQQAATVLADVEHNRGVVALLRAGADTIAEQQREIERLKSAIRLHRDQKADDRCWLDDDVLYGVLGEGIDSDNRVGDEAAMLENCKRFIRNRCGGGGPWKSYAELEAENAALREQLKSWDTSSESG